MGGRGTFWQCSAQPGHCGARGGGFRAGEGVLGAGGGTSGEGVLGGFGSLGSSSGACGSLRFGSHPALGDVGSHGCDPHHHCH